MHMREYININTVDYRHKPSAIGMQKQTYGLRKICNKQIKNL